MERLTKALIGTLVVSAFACSMLSCNGDERRESKRPRDLSADLSEQHLVPFEELAVVNILGNQMHEQHFSSGATCGECHLTTQPMPIEVAHEVCEECHPEQMVAKPVWKNHCLSCHYFTQAAQDSANDPEVMMATLCSKCHLDSGLGGSVYAVSGHTTCEMVHCANCHRPHASDAPAAAELCATCHEELSALQHPAGGQAKCSICHGAHRPPPDGTQLCTACHGKAENVLVHKIPNHPQDCLACHNAHFINLEIKGVCVDCHEDRVYNGGAYQPSGHRDCENCHVLEDFMFKGQASCRNCHAEQGAVRYNDRVPSEHKRCTTCHAPHSWYASYERNCQQCHDLDNVDEHSFAVHEGVECSQCHDPHNVADMTRSGQCSTCHEAVPSFGSAAPEMHLTCGNCHPEVANRNFDFIGWDNSCQHCHSQALAEPMLGWDEVPVGHLDCSLCHQTHSMQQVGVANSCAICHADVAAEAPNEMHGECFNCHTTDHSVEFAGVDGSCRACHGEPPGTHSAAGHQECFSCHAQHSFTPDISLCLVCHADKETDHYYDPEEDVHCTDCHLFSE